MESLFLFRRYVFKYLTESSLYIKVIGSRSRSEERKSVPMFVGGLLRLKGSHVRESFRLFVIFIHRSHGKWNTADIHKIKKIWKRKKYTHTTIQQWPGAYLLHRCCNNYYAEKVLFNMISL